MAWAVYRANTVRVAGTAVVVFGAVAVGDAVLVAWATKTESPLLRGFLVSAAAFLAVGSTFYAGLLDRLVGAHSFGHAAAPISVVLRSLPYGRLIVADLVLSFITGLASLFLLIPGLVVFTLLCLVGPLVNIEDHSPVAAFRRSARLVRPHFWLVAMLVTVPIFVESELEGVVELATHGEALILAFVLHGLFGMVVGAAVGLIEVCLAYQLAARYPR